MGLGVSAIAREIGCSRSSVYRAIEPGASLDYRRRSRFEGHVERVREVVFAYPLMPATVVKLVAGWPGSLRRLQELVHPMRFPALQASVSSGVVVRPAALVAAPLVGEGVRGGNS